MHNSRCNHPVRSRLLKTPKDSSALAQDLGSVQRSKLCNMNLRQRNRRAIRTCGQGTGKMNTIWFNLCRVSLEGP